MPERTNAKTNEVLEPNYIRSSIPHCTSFDCGLYVLFRLCIVVFVMQMQFVVCEMATEFSVLRFRNVQFVCKTGHVST
jgi:hypothetical protein